MSFITSMSRRLLGDDIVSGEDVVALGDVIYSKDMSETIQSAAATYVISRKMFPKADASACIASTTGAFPKAGASACIASASACAGRPSMQECSARNGVSQTLEQKVQIPGTGIGR